MKFCNHNETATIIWLGFAFSHATVNLAKLAILSNSLLLGVPALTKVYKVDPLQHQQTILPTY